MKKRSMIVTAIVVAVIGTGAVFAGSKYRGHGHGFYGGHGHRIEHMVDKLDDHLDLSSDQKIAIKQILDQGASSWKQGKVNRMEMRLKILELDPASAEYDASLQTVAAELSNLVNNRALSFGQTVKDVAMVLTPEQRLEARHLINKRLERMSKRMSEKGSHDHN